MDITELILSDHHEQRRMFAMLDDVDRADTARRSGPVDPPVRDARGARPGRGAVLLSRAAKLGERRHEDEEVEETKDAIGDHNDIRDGILESAQARGRHRWLVDGVTAARKANDEHMGEEEHEGLADFRRYVDLDTRHRIAVVFARYEAANVDGVPIEDKDPDQYIKDNS